MYTGGSANIEYGDRISVSGVHDGHPLLTEASVEADFTRLYRSAYRPIRRYLIRMLGNDGAEDVTADVFATLWERWRDVPARDDARYAWAFGVAHFKVLETIRVKQRRRLAAARAVEIRPTQVTAGPEEIVIAMEQVRRILDLLPRAERQAVELTVLGDLTSKQAAEVLGCPVSTVTTRVSRARTRLAALVREQEAGVNDA